jgi:Raf kinase inhibitor-like YbhB/YbcL family protein
VSGAPRWTPPLLLAIAIIVSLVACGGDDDGTDSTPAASEERGTATAVRTGPSQTTAAGDGQLTSESLTPDQPIPARYTCDGEDVSPPLSWGDPPRDTQSFMLLMEDLDAPGGTYLHWLIHDIDVNARGLPEGVAKTAEPANGEGGVQIENDFGETGYGGPCPPAGNPHRYEFKLIYLDSPIELEPGATREQVDAAVAGHPIGESSFIVTYER